MADLSSGYHANIVLNPGDVCRVTTGGVATVVSAYGAPAGTTTVTASTQDFGPYLVNAKLRVNSVSGVASYRKLAPDDSQQSIGGDEIDAYVRAIERAGSSIDSATLAALDRFVRTGRAAGWWDKLIEVAPFCGTTLAGALVKLKHAGTESLANTNFAEADFSQDEGFGKLTGNTNAYLDTGFVPSLNGITSSDICFGVELLGFTKTNAPDASFGTTGWPLGSMTQGAAEPPLAVAEAGGGFGPASNRASMAPFGFNLYNATASVVQSFKAGALTRYGGAPTPATFGHSITLMATRRVDNNLYYANVKMGLVILGKALTDAQCISLAKAVETLRGSIRKQRSRPYIVVGDSISACQSTSSFATAFPYLVAAKIGATVIDHAQPDARVSIGFTAGGIPNHLSLVSRRAYSELSSAALISLMGGTNDMSSDGAVGGTAGTITTYGTNIGTMLAAFKATGARVICLSAPYRTDTGSHNTTKQEAYAAAAAAAAKAAGVPFANIYQKISDTGSAATYMADQVHPNSLGHALIAQAAIDAFDGLLTRTVSIAPGALTANTPGTVAVTILNAVVGMPVRCIPLTAPQGGVTYTAAVTGNDTVTVSVNSATSLTPSALSCRLEVVCGY